VARKREQVAIEAMLKGEGQKVQALRIAAGLPSFVFSRPDVGTGMDAGSMGGRMGMSRGLLGLMHGNVPSWHGSGIGMGPTSTVGRRGMLLARTWYC
jgi:hypothetical protein